MEAPTRGQVIERIVRRADLDEFAERVLDSFWERPEFQALHPPREAVLAWVRWNLDLVIRWLAGGRPPTDAELEAFRVQARARAAEGFPPDIVPANFRRGARFAWRALMEAATDAERPALLESADLLFDYVDRVSRIFSEVYADATGSAPGAADEAAARALLARIAAEEPPGAEDHDLAERIGFRLDRAAQPFVIALPGRAFEDHARLAAELRRGGALAASEGRRVVGLAAPGARRRATPGAPGNVAREPTRDPAAHLPADAITARLPPAIGPERARGLDELRATVDLALARGRTGELDPDDYLAELLLLRSPRIAAQIARRVYGPLGDELAHTLDVLVAHSFERSSTAAELPVHRNTLRGRITRIGELTGIDLDSAEGRGLAWLAWLQRRGWTSRTVAGGGGAARVGG